MNNSIDIGKSIDFIGRIKPSLLLSGISPSLSGLTDEELAASAATGSTNHFEAIVRRYSSAMYRLAYRLSGNRGDAEDIVQETFVKLFRALPTADTSRPIKPWLYKIAVNTSLSLLRKRSGTKNVNLDEAADFVHSGDFSEISAAGIDAQKALDRLPPAFRQMIVLRAVEDLPFAEIADILDIPEPTARTRFKRAKDMLRSFI